MIDCAGLEGRWRAFQGRHDRPDRRGHASGGRRAVRRQRLAVLRDGALYAGTSSGLGILAATFARNSGQVGLIVLLLVMPIIMLSGTWNLRESMPIWLCSAWSICHCCDGVLLKGSGIAVVLPLALSMAALGLGVARFRGQFC